MAKVFKPKPDSEGASVVQFTTGDIEKPRECADSEPINHVPYVDMYSTPEEVVVEIEIPGVRREDVELTIFKNTLNIKALKYECFEETGVKYVCMERTFGRVFRAIDIPFAVNAAAINAAYHNGIIRIVLPRVEEKRGKPRIIAIEDQSK